MYHILYTIYYILYTIYYIIYKESLTPSSRFLQILSPLGVLQGKLPVLIAFLSEATMSSLPRFCDSYNSSTCIPLTHVLKKLVCSSLLT